VFVMSLYSLSTLKVVFFDLLSFLYQWTLFFCPICDISSIFSWHGGLLKIGVKNENYEKARSWDSETVIFCISGLFLTLITTRPSV
jgi:hypothetical protein